jgi:outer membrane protein OmpU
MNNFKKIGLSALAGSLVAFSANAGTLSATGSASLSFSNADTKSLTDEGNQWTMGDSITMTGSGEMDNGMTISVSFEIDNDDVGGGNVYDSHSMTLDTNGMGTITFAGHGGSSAMSMMDDKTPNAYEEAWDGLDSGTTAVVINGYSGNNMITYTSESFSGAVFTVAWIPSEATAATGNKSTYVDYGVTITPEMVDGLSLGYAAGTTEITAGTEVDESTMYATYAVGGLTIGYQSSEYDAPTSSASDDSTAIGISYAVNDNLSISYNEHTVDVGSSATDQESDGFSVSYTMGGMTLAGHSNEMSSVNGVSGTDDEGYEINLSFAF